MSHLATVAIRGRFRQALFSLVALLTFVEGCGAGAFEVPDTWPRQRLRPSWQLQLHTNPVLTYRPREYAVPVWDEKAGNVLVGSNDGVIVCLDGQRGTERWGYRTDGPIWAAARIEGDNVFVGTANGSVFALNRLTGEPVWKQPHFSAGAVGAQPAAAGGRLFITFDTNELKALDAGAGEVIWTYQRDHLSAFTLAGHAAPLVHGDTVIVGFSDGVLAALRVEDGSVVWERELASEASRFKDADGDPVVRDGTLYASSNAGGVYALDPATGNVRWHHAMLGASGPAVTTGNVFVTSVDDRELRCLDRATGKAVWRSGFHRGTPSTPTVATGYVFVSTTRSLVTLDAESGRSIERFTTPDGFTARPAVGGGWLFVLSNRGHVHAMGVH